MGFNNTVTVVGNVTRDPELRFTPNGAAVANFGLAWNRKGQNDEEVVSFFDVTCWSGLAENVAESITKTLAICMRCGSPANRTQRITKDRDRVVVGATDVYEARCRKCFEPPDED